MNLWTGKKKSEENSGPFLSKYSVQFKSVDLEAFKIAGRMNFLKNSICFYFVRHNSDRLEHSMGLYFSYYFPTEQFHMQLQLQNAQSGFSEE